MKYTAFPIICFLLISCGNQTEKETKVSTTLSYAFDTVMVDSGDEFLHLNDGLFNAALSADGKYLFNWNREAMTLEKIDLEELKLVNKILYEKEGPDGIGAFVFNYANTPDDNSIFWTNRIKGIWDQEGKLLRALPIDKLLEGTEHTKEVMLSLLAPLPNQPDKFLTVYREYKSNGFYFLIFDFADDTFRKIPLPEMNKLSEFEVLEMYGGQWMGSFNAGAMLSIQNDKVIMGMNSFNQAYVYDMLADTLYFKSWDGPLVGSKQTVSLPKEVEVDKPQRGDIRRLAEEDISYGRFFWDKESKQYYRFSAKSIFGEEKTEHGEHKEIGADVFLSIFDSDFKLTTESKIPEIQSRPAKHFFKDGKIWIFENLADELGFVRMTLDR